MAMHGNDREQGRTATLSPNSYGDGWYHPHSSDWTAGIVPSATLEHLDPQAIARAREGYVEGYGPRISAKDVASWDDAYFLEKARLTLDGQITRAAVLLLGADTATHLLTPHPAQMTWKLFGQQQAYKHFRLPFLLNATQLVNRINNPALRLPAPGQLPDRKVSKYDEKSLLEALYNCIAHQDYTKNSRIIVTEEAHRIQFISVGEFYDGTPDNYALQERSPRRFRNPFLVKALTHLGLVSGVGYGGRWMAQDQVRRFLPLPDYDLTTDGEVQLSIPGAAMDVAYSQQLMEQPDLPLEDVLLLDQVQKGLEISPASARRLTDAGLLEGKKIKAPAVTGDVLFETEV